jgi:hypothetical protein
VGGLLVSSDIFINIGEIEEGLVDLTITNGTHSYCQTMEVEDGAEKNDLLSIMFDDLILQELLEGLMREIL